jgi:hypothetical protein
MAKLAATASESFALTAKIGKEVMIAEVRCVDGDLAALNRLVAEKCRFLALREPLVPREATSTITYDVFIGHPNPNSLELVRLARNNPPEAEGWEMRMEAAALLNKPVKHLAPILSGSVDVTYSAEWIMQNGAKATTLKQHLDEPDPGVGFLTLLDLNNVTAGTDDASIAGWCEFPGLIGAFCWWNTTADILMRGDTRDDVLIGSRYRPHRDDLIAKERLFWDALSMARAKYEWTDGFSDVELEPLISFFREYAAYRGAVIELAREVVSPDLCERLERRI